MAENELPAREAMEFDVVIVGAGPAGLAAAIRLKQRSPDISVVVVEKGSEVGAHILSGAVIDPIGLDRLLPDWRNDEDTPIKTKVSDDRFYWLSATALDPAAEFHDAAADVEPRQLHRVARQCLPLARHQGGVGSASRSIRASPRSRCSTMPNGAVAGVATGDMGIGKDGKPTDNFTRGMELRAKYTLFAEGARGSLTKTLLKRFGLDTRSRAAEIRHRAEGAVAGRARQAPRPDWCSTRSAGRSTTRPAAARSSITSTTIWCRSASSCISTTRTPTSTRSRSSSASRPIRWCARPSKAASGSPMARAPSPKAATSRCRSSRSRAAR